MTVVASIQEFNSRAQQEWGDVRRTHAQLFDGETTQIRDWINFKTCPSELKVHLADTILRESTPTCGAVSGSGDARWFIQQFGHDIRVIDPPFDGRRLPVIQSALMLLAYAHFNLFASPEERAASGDLNLIFGMGGSGLASLYLLSQLEYLFRVNSSCLDADGTITAAIPASLANCPGLKGKNVGNRVNQIQLAFLLYLHSNPDSLSTTLTRLNDDLSIADRLSHIRPSAMHGLLGDASSEGVFYALFLAMLYYGHSSHANAS